MVAEYADIWHSFATRETYPAKSDVLAQHCAASGRDPATVARSTGVSGDGEGADGLIADAEALVGLGVTLLTVGTGGPDYDLTSAEALCRWRDSR
jgi:hypothetical protein